MNNEPVAWMLADKEAEHIRSIMAVQHDFVPEGCVEIPLYTHPVKELDRELLDKTIIDQQNEIKDLRKNLDVALMIVNKPKLTDEELLDFINAFCLDMGDYWELTEINAIPMIRAILRKAQEK